MTHEDTEASTARYTCSVCGEQKPAVSGKPPRNWKVYGKSRFCATCYKSNYITRAAEFPVMFIEGVDIPNTALIQRLEKALKSKNTAKVAAEQFKSDLDAELAKKAKLDTLKAALKRDWMLTTIGANNLLEECRRADVLMSEELLASKKIPNFEVPVLVMPNGEKRSTWAYHTVRKHVPSLSPSTANAIANNVVRDYKKQRFSSRFWFSENSLSYKYPYPISYQIKQASIRFSDRGFPQVRIPIGDGLYWATLRYDKRKHGELFSKFVDGTAKVAQVTLTKSKLRCKADVNSSKNLILSERDLNSSNKAFMSLRVKIIYSKAIPARAPGDKILIVKTDPVAFIAASCNEHSVWVLNADDVKRQYAYYGHLVRRIEEHENHRQRFADDQKYYKRTRRQRRNSILAAQDRNCTKHRNWVDNWIGNAVVEIADYAKRIGASTVHYDDTDKSFCPKFRWFEFANKLNQKLQERSIGYIHVSNLQPEADEDGLQQSDEGVLEAAHA